MELFHDRTKTDCYVTMLYNLCDSISYLYIEQIAHIHLVLVQPSYLRFEFRILPRTNEGLMALSVYDG